jgi:predicted acyl esterase
MATQPDDLIFTDPVSPFAGEYPGFHPHTVKDRDMIIEYDVAVAMRDGATLYVDVYRPDRPGRFPPLIGWGPYGKHGRVTYALLGNTGLRDEDFNQHTKFEAADPVYWCRNGYVIINPDPRGCWWSEGDLTLMSEQEVEDIYDLIEWAGTREWSNGKVGMQGVSYLAWSQWKVAAANPPHLAAINPWEGVSDFYRELFTHGGIPETLFCEMVYDSWRFSTTRVENVLAMQKLHPLYDGYWEGKNADLSKIVVPALVVASWTDHGLHNRGTLEGFKQISSEHKWLIVHGRKKWWHFYLPESVEKQRQFFDHFLRGIDNHVKDWPKVTIEVRKGYYRGKTRTENEWPLARTMYTKFFLDAGSAALGETPPAAASSVRYSADRVFDLNDPSKYSYYFLKSLEDRPHLRRGKDVADRPKRTAFEVAFSERTELTGHTSLRLWVEADGSDDLDLFVALEKIDRAGNLVPFAFFGNHDDGPVALGWLRASHRELDPQRSTPWQPWHTHTREVKLTPGEIVPVDIEFWPTSVLFEPGERLRLVVQGSDIYWYPSEGHTDGHLDTVNKGDHVIHTGGKYESFLLAPVIPQL